jgi:hypothetical protein
MTLSIKMLLGEFVYKGAIYKGIGRAFTRGGGGYQGLATKK